MTRLAKLVRFAGIAALALLVLPLFGCAAKIRNISHHPLLVDADPTLAEAEQKIRAGAELLGWVIDKESPGVLLATLHIRAHRAAVAVEYDATHFDVEYRTSENLNDNGDGTIHNNYNKWVNHLVLAISGTKPARL